MNELNELISFILLPETEKSGTVPVFKTEVSPSGDWREFSIDLSILCNCDYVLLSPFYLFSPAEPPRPHRALPAQTQRQPSQPGLHSLHHGDAPPKPEPNAPLHRRIRRRLADPHEMRVPRESVVPAVHSRGVGAELHGVHRFHGQQRQPAEPLLAALRQRVELHAGPLQSVRKSWKRG